MINASIFTLWGLVILLKAAAVIGIFRRGLWTRYPVLTAFLVVACLKSAILVTSLATAGTLGYFTAWFNSREFSNLLYLLLSGESFAQFLRNMPRSRPFGLALFCTTGGISALAVSALAAERLQGWANSEIELPTWNTAALCLLFLLLTENFWRVLRVPLIHENAHRNCLNLQLLLAGEVLSRWLIMTSGGEYWFTAAAQFVLLATAAVSFFGWAFRFSPAGEGFTSLPSLSIGLEGKARH